MKRKKSVTGKKSKEAYEAPEIQKVRVTSSYRMACTAETGGSAAPYSSGGG